MPCPISAADQNRSVMQNLNSEMRYGMQLDDSIRKVNSRAEGVMPMQSYDDSRYNVLGWFDGCC